jgi:hypothetical protein
MQQQVNQSLAAQQVCEEESGQHNQRRARAVDCKLLGICYAELLLDERDRQLHSLLVTDEDRQAKVDSSARNKLQEQ